MNPPNYQDGSIVNLMSSISEALGYKTIYNNLRILPSDSLKQYENIILIVIDGLGYNYLRKKGNNSALKKYMISAVDTVFLPTTACAIPTFLTGVAPMQHACTGWFMNLKEVGAVTKILKFSSRIGGDSYSKYGVNISEILDYPGLFNKFKAKTYIINSIEINKSDFNDFTSGNAKRVKYNSINSFFKSITRAVKSKGKRKYIYAYWNDLDHLNHLHGVFSKKSEKHFSILDKKFNKFLTEIKGTKSAVIVTSDHGFVNISKKGKINIKDHSKLKECLTLPLCGEARTAYSYVHPSRAEEFENYFKNKLSKYCSLYKSKELVDRKYFGLFSPNPKLFDRIGDYIIVCKDGFVIKDYLNDAERKKHHFGYHGGISEDEMLVPLIVVDCNK